VSAFFRDTSHQRRVLIWDIGANDGEWADSIMKRLPKPHRRQTHLSVFEPQPRFARKLASLAEAWSGTFYAAAVATTDGNMSFYAPPRGASKSATISASLLSASHPEVPKERVTVPTIDLAALMRQKLQPDDRVLMKIDVEGYEYQLFPHLLATGALCLVDYLHIEWHPNALPSATLLSGLSIREAMNMVLNGCPRPPKAITHEGQQLPFMKYALGCPGGRSPAPRQPP